MSLKTFPLEVVMNDRITPTIQRLVFRRGDGEPLDFVPGQFVNIHFEADGQAVHRSYSIASPPDGASFEIAVSPVQGGRATRLFEALLRGDSIDASGPYGRFVLRADPPCRYVLVGTGTGVTPYRAMLPQLARLLEQGYTVVLLIGVWRREELLYGEQFLEFARQHPGFEMLACYSRDMPQSPAEYERRGYVQAQFDALGLDPERDIVYLCGNPNMVDDAMHYLRERDFTIPRLRREKYLPSKT